VLQNTTSQYHKHLLQNVKCKVGQHKLFLDWYICKQNAVMTIVC